VGGNFILVLVLTLIVLGGAGFMALRGWMKALAASSTSSRRSDLTRGSFLEQYDSLTLNSNDIILLMDARGEIVRANDRAAESYGYERSELEGLNIRSLRAPDTIDHVEEQMQAVQAKGGLVFETRHRRRGGETFPVETSARVIELDGATYFQSIIRDITRRKQEEWRLTRLNECLLGFGADPVQNINSLVALCGEMLGAATSLYNRLEGGLLCSIGQWNTPQDYQAEDKPEGHLCFDVIRNEKDEMMVVRDLADSRYFISDPNVRKYGLRTYIGKAVRFGDENVGSL
jgi:PAS domain S-box-containing protein